MKGFRQRVVGVLGRGLLTARSLVRAPHHSGGGSLPGSIRAHADLVILSFSMSSCRGQRMPTSRRRRKIPPTRPKTRRPSVSIRHSSRHHPTKVPRHHLQLRYKMREASHPTMLPLLEPRWAAVPIPLPNTIYPKPAVWQVSLRTAALVRRQGKDSR